MKLHSSIFRLNILLVLSLFFAADVVGQQNVGESNLSKDTKDYKLTLQHTTLVVSDFSESKKFYTEILGLKDLYADWLPEKQIFLSLGDNLELHVGEVSGVEINPSPINHFALSTNDFDGYLKYLESKGVIYSSLGGQHKGAINNRPDGVRQTYIQDPDGYWIEINDAN